MSRLLALVALAAALSAAAVTNDAVYTAFPASGEGFADVPSAFSPIRWIRVGGMRNVRDIGGWNGLRAGRAFRGSEPDCRDPGHGLNVTEDGRRMLTETLGVVTDLDLRKPEECPTPDRSALGVRLVRVPLEAYEDAFTQTNLYAQALRVFADGRNYPIYFHCWGGADRTGTVAFLVEGLCGVVEPDLYVDYELTSLSVFGVRSRNATGRHTLSAFLERLTGYPGATLPEKIAVYARASLGLSEDEIAAIRRNMKGDGAWPD